MAQKLVTRADCDEVIKRCIASDKFEVVNFKIKPFEDKDREYYKPDCVLEISAKISKNISRFRFFLKKFQSEYPALNDFFKTFRASEREILFYEHFLPMLEGVLADYAADYVATYLYGHPDRFMVVEDVQLKHFTLSRKCNPHVLDRFHVSLALKALAKLHAASWVYEEKLNSPRLFGKVDLLAQDPIWSNEDDCLVVESGVRGLKALIKEPNTNLDALVKRTFEIMKFQTKYRNVLCHNNLHTKNLLFKYNKNNIPTECKLINFGYCRYFIPAHDVLTLIFNCTNQAFRKHYFTYLVEYYYKSLSNELTKQELLINQFMTFQDFQQSINYLMPAIKLKAALHVEDFGAKPGFYKLIQKNEQIHRKYMYEDKSLFMLELYEKDPIFKEMITETLDELKETLKMPQVSRENCYELLEGLFETTDYDLKCFSVSPVAEEREMYELVLEASNGKNCEAKQYKYLVQCCEDGLFKVLNQIID